MNDRSPSPRSSRGLSTLCPPRLFGIGDRRHGQSVDNPASRSAIDPAGTGFNVAGGLRVAKGAVSDGTRHRRNIALFIGRLLVVPDAPRCMDLKGAMSVWAAGRRWRRLSEGFSIACPRHLGVNGERYRGQGVGNPVSGVPRADAGAACRAPTKTEHRPIQKRAGPARPRAEHRPFHAATVGPVQDHGGPVGRAATRPQAEMEKGDVPLLGGADPGESAPALKWAMFGRGAPRPWARRRILLTYTVVPSSLLPSAGPQR